MDPEDEALFSETIKSFRSEYDQPSLLRVRGEYAGLHRLIGQLSSKVSGVNSSIEKEFLAAYRVHMLHIQEELKELKQRMKDAETALNDDGQVAKLEHEVTWFSDETSRLKTHASNMNRDMQHIVTRISALRDQNVFLSEQLKAVMKRCRVLEAEINYAKREEIATTLENHKSKSLSRIQNENSMKKSASTPILPSSTSVRSHGNSKMQRTSSTVAKLRSAQERSNKPVITDVLLSQTKKKLNQRSLESSSSIETLEKFLANRTPTEVALEQAVEKVWSLMVQRKAASALQLNPGLTPQEVVVDPGGITGLGLEHFSDVDRLAVMTHLLSDPLQFEAIVHTLAEYLQT